MSDKRDANRQFPGRGKGRRVKARNAAKAQGELDGISENAKQKQLGSLRAWGIVRKVVIGLAVGIVLLLLGWCLK